MNTNIFEIDDEARVAVRLSEKKNTTDPYAMRKNVLELFAIAGRPLTANELAVGYWRKFGKTPSGKTPSAMAMSICLSHMKKAGLVSRNGDQFEVLNATTAAA